MVIAIVELAYGIDFPSKNNGKYPPNASKTRDIVETSNQNEQQVWTLQDGQPTSISLSTGASNGIYTEITNGQIESGLTLIIDTISSEK